MNSTEQLLLKNEYTEWQFNVQPMRTGELPLMLVVAVKEYVNDNLHKREIVLEEVIRVVAEVDETVEDTADFQSAGYTFVYTTTPERTRKGFTFLASSRNHINLAVSIAVVIALTAGVWATGTWLGWFKSDRQPENPFPEVIKPDSGIGQPELPPLTDTIFITDPEAIQDSLTSKMDSIGLPPPFKNRTGTSKNNFRRKVQPKPSSRPVRPGNGDIQEAETSPRDSVSSPGGDSQGIKTIPIKPLPDPAHSRKSGFTMVDVKGGRLALGRHYEKDACLSDSVNIRSFLIGKYEVTQADWVEIMGSNPAFKKTCSLCPVENISWEDIQEFIRKASKAHDKQYRLPFEAEWEYAAQGGIKTLGYKYAGSNRPGDVAWFSTIREHSHEVGLKNPNELGVYDMSGNVREWCQDIFPAYLKCKSSDSIKKALRGGAWPNTAGKIGVTDKVREKTGHKDEQSGFRLVTDY